jgi:O-antigen ligase
LTVKTIRIGICVLLAFSVLAHGAVEPWSETALEIGAAALLLIWGVLLALGKVSDIRTNPLFWPIASFWLFCFVQYAARLSAVPFLTEIELLKFSALAILFFLAVQAYRTLGQWRGFVWFLLSLGFLVSLFGILQYFTFNGKLYWFRELQYGGVPFGPYVNRNHFSGLMEMIVPSGLALLLARAEDRDRMPLITVLTLIPIGALFLAASRGGLSAFALELLLLFVLIFARQRGSGPFVAAGIVLVLAGGLVAWLGVGQAFDRFAALRALEVKEDRRVEMVHDSWRIFVDHPVFGTGLGSLQEVFPRYATVDDGTIVNHSHNDYVEALAETGLIGGLCGAAFLILLVAMSWKRLTLAQRGADWALHLGAVAACAGILFHSLVDFNLHIPSNALLFLLQAALATSAAPNDRSVPLRARRP